MAISDIYSKRQKKRRGAINDVYQYDDIPNPLKVQIIQIIRDSIGFPAVKNRYSSYENEADKIYRIIHETLAREYGVFQLKQYFHDDFTALTDFFIAEPDAEKFLDFVELSMKIAKGYITINSFKFRDITRQNADEAIQELNERFKEHGVGYQFESGEIIRIDSQIIHSEVVKPTLSLLGDEPFFAGSNDEFLSAHEHYRHKRYKECLNDCLKSFESLMKAIHEKHQWEYNQHDTASKLVNSCLHNNLIPAYLQSQFTSLKTMLETGVSTIRNKNAAHGQGPDVKDVPEEMASYMLHLTATNLLFLTKCEQNLN